jgi:GNAT superfamily N-acetyltransferase
MAIVRSAVDDDIPRILELYQQLVISTSQAELHHNPSPDDYWRAFVEICALPGYELFVAEDEGEIVGTLVLLIAPNLSHNALPWAVIENIVVDERYQGRGIGKLLMDQAIARAKEAGCYKIQLSSDKRRKEAHQFYRSLGFEASADSFRLYF